jgi:hypothetical protein
VLLHYYAHPLLLEKKIICIILLIISLIEVFLLHDLIEHFITLNEVKKKKKIDRISGSWIFGLNHN